MSRQDYNQKFLQYVVAEICQSIGFDYVNSTSLDVLTDVLERHLRKLASLTHDIAEQCGHTHASVEDVQHCFRLSNTSLQELIDYIQQMEEVKLTVKPKKYPYPKKSNLQFNKNPNATDLEYVYPYFPSLVHTTESTSKEADTSTSQIANIPTSAVPEKQSDEHNNSSDEDDDAVSDDESVGDGDEPLWLKQQIKQSQRQLKKELSHTQGIAPSSVVHSAEPISPFETNPAPQPEQNKTSLWDLPMLPRPKLSTTTKGSFSSKSEPSETVGKATKHSKTKTSITSRIEEVNRLLHDPILAKGSHGAGSSPVPTRQPVKSPTVPVVPSKKRKESVDSVHSETNSSLPFASPKSMDDAINAVVIRATKEAEEAELMKFSHLIDDSSSSDESDIAVSHKTEEMLQLQKRGLQKPLEEESPNRPPLTPSPAPSNQSLIIDQEIDIDTSPRDSPSSSPERMEISTNTISERTWSLDSPKLSFKTSTFSFNDPPAPQETKKDEVKPKKKIKLPKKLKAKTKEKKRRSSSEQTVVPPKVHLSHKKDKPVEKLILKKSKFGETKVVKPRKEKQFPEPLPVEHAPLPVPKLSALPKLSAAVSAPLVVPPPKKKEKKEKKKKKEKEKEKQKEEKTVKKIKEDLTPIPKLTVKMAPSSKDVGILKAAKIKRKKSTERKVGRPRKTAEPKISLKKEVQRGVTTETISVGSKVGVIYDAQGNKIWICPGCNKPDDGSPMIGCDSCDGWYHWPCVGITMEPSKDEWYCPNCA